MWRAGVWCVVGALAVTACTGDDNPNSDRDELLEQLEELGGGTGNTDITLNDTTGIITVGEQPLDVSFLLDTPGAAAWGPQRQITGIPDQWRPLTSYSVTAADAFEVRDTNMVTRVVFATLAASGVILQPDSRQRIIDAPFAQRDRGDEIYYSIPVYTGSVTVGTTTCAVDIRQSPDLRATNSPSPNESIVVVAEGTPDLPPWGAVISTFSEDLDITHAEAEAITPPGIDGPIVQGREVAASLIEQTCGQLPDDYPPITTNAFTTP